jgi:F420-dependent oxidoreductase-like protein
MRFALSTAPQNCRWEDVLAVWKEADQIPLFESAWTFDHFEPIFSDRSGPCLEGWMTLAALLQATTRIRGGNLVSGMVYRHPAVLANMAATLDITSGGRLELGLGAAWNTDECGAYGIELGTLTERFDRFDEGMEVIVRLLTQERSSFAGRYFTLDEAWCEPKPIQRPHPPICIGGQGERRTIPAVARWAQHWNAGRPEPDAFARKRDILWERCADIGRDPSEITTSVLLVRADPGRLAAEAAAWGERGVDLVLVALPAYDPALLAPIAEALAPLAS